MQSQRLLLVEPQDLTFHMEQGRPTCTIRMSNNSREYVAFKVMAVDPNRFMASTPLGIMNPGSYREIEVTMRARVGDLPNVLHGDRFGIKSLVVNPDDTIERIRTLFNTQRHRVDVFKLRVARVHHQDRNLNYIQQPDRNRRSSWNLLRTSFIVVFSSLIFWYLMMQILSRLWYPSTPCIYVSKVVTSMLIKMRMVCIWKCSSTMMISAITFLVLMMMKNTAVEAAGDWIIIRRTVLHLSLYFLAIIREKLFLLFTRWLDVGFGAFLYLFRSVFGQQQRRQPRYRN